jgi:hypothetical protein
METTMERVKGRNVGDTFHYSQICGDAVHNTMRKISVVEEVLYTGTELALDYWCTKDWLVLQLEKSWALDELERETQVLFN